VRIPKSLIERISCQRESRQLAGSRAACKSVFICDVMKGESTHTWVVRYNLHKLPPKPVQSAATEARVSQSFIFAQTSNECLRNAVTNVNPPEIQSLYATNCLSEHSGRRCTSPESHMEEQMEPVDRRHYHRHHHSENEIEILSGHVLPGWIRRVRPFRRSNGTVQDPNTGDQLLPQLCKLPHFSSECDVVSSIGACAD
jgi:hypothetical protein